VYEGIGTTGTIIYECTRAIGIKLYEGMEAVVSIMYEGTRAIGRIVYESGQVAGTCECSNEPSSSIKCGEFLD